MKGKLYKVGATTPIEVMPKNGKKFVLAEMQEYVGGYIEIIRLPSGNIMVMDEEGKLKEKEINKTATFYAEDVIQRGDYIAGDALIIPSNMID